MFSFVRMRLGGAEHGNNDFLQFKCHTYFVDGCKSIVCTGIYFMFRLPITMPVHNESYRQQIDLHYNI